MKNYSKGNFRVEIEKKQGQKGMYFTANLVKMYKSKDGTPGEFKFNMNLSDIPVIMAIFQKMSLDNVKSSEQQEPQANGYQRKPQADTYFDKNDESEIPF